MWSKSLRGKLKKGERTKELLRRVQMRDIVLLKHENLDMVSAEELCRKKVKAIINAAETMTGEFRTEGAMHCLKAGIPIVEINEADFDRFQEGDKLSIHHGDYIICRNEIIACWPVTDLQLQQKQALALQLEENKLKAFISNTLEYACQEKKWFFGPLREPALKTDLQGKYVLIVVRGKGYKEDLNSLADFIAFEKPVFIGVDGGADALLEQGLQPDMIIGDMDSVSDDALRCGAECIVHAYTDGRAPGMERLKQLGVRASVLPAAGTSEDVAIWIAYEQQSRWIITIGTHTHMIDFLEKGRNGMASTLLVRLKAGPRLLDAKGFSKLQQDLRKDRRWLLMPVAAAFPLLAIVLLHPITRQLVEYFLISMKWMMAAK